MIGSLIKLAVCCQCAAKKEGKRTQYVLLLMHLDLQVRGGPAEIAACPEGLISLPWTPLMKKGADTWKSTR